MPLSCGELIKEAVQQWIEAHRSKGLISEELYKLMQENIDKVVSNKTMLLNLAFTALHLVNLSLCSRLFSYNSADHPRLHEMIDPLTSRKLIATVLVCVEPVTVLNHVEHITNALRSEHAGETSTCSTTTA